MGKNTGSGSEVLTYNLESGKMIESFRVFEGIRVHGISSIRLNSSGASSCTKLAFVLVIFGEKRVKLCRISVEMIDEVCVNLVPLCSLPRFNHWVLDVCFLKVSVLFIILYLSGLASINFKILIGSRAVTLLPRQVVIAAVILPLDAVITLFMFGILVNLE